MFIIKKIIPFEKELLFKTKVCEITSISLEHSISKVEEDLISGNFHINGDYKMTEGSINREKFDYNVEFDIALDSRYDTKNMMVDIEDFTYQIVNDEILKVKIDLYIDGEIIKDDVIETKPDEVFLESLLQVEENKNLMDNFNEVEENKIDELFEIDSESKRNDELENSSNIFSNMNDSETYSTYKIYIAKEDDTIEKIIEKYNINMDLLASYNDIQTVNAGDKIIIPTVFDGQ